MTETFKYRLLVLGAILIGQGLLLIGQLARWQVLSHVLLVQKAHSIQSQPREIDPHRGMILDRNGHILAMEDFTYRITAAPRWVKDPDRVAAELALWLPQPKAELRETLASDALYALLAKGMSPQVAEAVEELNLDGVQIAPHSCRFYPEDSLTGHLLGFVNAEGQGFGLEKHYYELLGGQPGQRWAACDPLGLLRDVPPKNGANLYLAMDYLLQQQVEQELARGVEESRATGGTVIVMDPRTGAVLAWASYPGYNPNLFPELASTNPQRFVDPAISKQYEPGSVAKVLTMAGALDSGLVNPRTAIQDSEAIEIGGQIIYNWDRKGHGLVSMEDVLALSLNVCAAQLSTRMGSHTFYGYLNAFGLGQRTGIDLSGESAGRLKQPGDTDWTESELGVNSFGQGMAVTPLQLISAVAAVANGGHLMRPHVVAGWMQEGGLQSTKPTLVRQVISPASARQLTEMLVQVVQRQVPAALVPGYRVAGKTGTAQIPIPGGYHPKDTIASFVGYLPAESPRIIILVKIDKPKSSPWGRDVAAPVFSRIAKRACHLLDIPPQDALLARR